MNRPYWLILLALGACVITACGDDDDSDSDKDGGPDSGDGTAGKDAGAGGTGGMMGGGTGGFGAPVSVECGARTCTSSGLSSLLSPPCCLDEEAGTCGMSSGGACMAMPEPDTRCPSVNFFGIINAAGCCTADDQCGISGTVLGQGCVPLQQFSGGGSGGAGGGFPGVTFPAPRSCSGEEPDAGTEPTEDAGT